MHKNGSGGAETLSCISLSKALLAARVFESHKITTEKWSLGSETICSMINKSTVADLVIDGALAVF